jgi:hypothetical protein
LEEEEAKGNQGENNDESGFWTRMAKVTRITKLWRS